MFKTQFCALIVGAILALLNIVITTSCNNNAHAEAFYDSPEYAQQLAVDVEQETYGEPVDGMHFDTQNVIEAYEYDDAYCIVYDDIDAGMVNVEIEVDRRTYETCLWACQLNDHFTGTLHHQYGNVWKFEFAHE